MTAVAVSVVSAQISPAQEDPGGHRLNAAERTAVAQILDRAAEQATAVAACPPNDTDTATASGRRCIAEEVRGSRSGLLDACFNAAKAALANAIYTRHECHKGYGVQAEAIAQGRAIQKLNSAGVYGKAAVAGGITPDIQWEVTYPGTTGKKSGRIDILLYDKDDPIAPIELVEVKKKPNARDAAAQLARYQRDFPKGANNRTVQARDLAGYSDTFRVLVRDCAERGVKKEVIEKFTVYQSAPGILLFAKNGKDVRDCGEQEEQPGGGEVEVPEAVPEEVPQFCADGCWAPAPGRDADNDGKDDFWEYFLDGHPELNDLPAWPKLPVVPIPDDEEVWVTVAAAAALAVVVLGIIAFCTGTAGGCLAFLGVAATAEAGGMSVGLAAGIAAALAAMGVGWLVYGDPHMVTLDGRAYDLMSVGEFTYLQIPELDVTVQARFEAFNDNLSILGPIATEVNDQHVEIGTDYVQVDGQEIVLDADGGSLLLGDGSAIVRDGTAYTLLWAGENEGAVLQRQGRNVRAFVPEGLETAGLAGNNNGDPTDDFDYRDGTPAGAEPSPELIHGAYADSWRITAEETMFTYGPGESTDTFTDPDFPESIADVSDLSDSVVTAATTVCADAGVTPGPQFDACILDVALTEDDSFAADSALVEGVPHDPSQSAFGSGSLTEDFEGQVSSSFESRTYETVGSTTLAGPLFDTPGYRMHVTNAPRHDQIDLGFDLYLFGPVSGTSTQQRLEVAVDGQEISEFNLDGAAPVASGGPDWSFNALGQGQTADGTAYTSFRATTTIPHAQPGLSIDLRPSNFRGLLDTALGIDNVELDLAVPAPASTTGTLPLTVSPGAAGGRFEATSEADTYVVNVTAGDRLTFSPTTCTASAKFSLVDTATDEEVFGQDHCLSSITTGALAGGQYELRVTPWGPAAYPGDYGFDLFTVPDAQTFAYSLGEVVADGEPGTGAGNLETASSVDRYTFSLPTGTAMRYERLGSYFNYRIIDTATGDAVGNGYTDADFNLPAGSYVLEVGHSGDKGTYSFRLFETPAPQTFGYTLGSTVSDGVPGAGAGRLETTASVDRYTFNLSAASTLQYQQVLQKFFNYRIVDTSSGDVVGTGHTDKQFNLPAGSYALEVGRGNDKGIYSFKLFSVPTPQSFAYTLGATVANGVPGAGAGTLETIASVDRFTFTTTAVTALQYDMLSVNFPNFRLVSLSSGQVVASGFRDQQFTVPPDQYAFEVTGIQGNYSFKLFEAPDPQTFAYALGSTISNGVPAAGAGNLETVASVDRYTFSVPASGEYQVQITALTAYKVIDALTNAVVLSDTTSRRVSLPAGEYVTEVGPGTSGTYTLRIYEVPAPQVFAYTLGSTVSNGVPAAGAGNLETTSSVDRYTFTLAQETKLQYEYFSPSFPFSFSVINQTSGQVVGTGNSNKQFTLPAGQYALEFGGGQSGTYSFQFFQVPVAQEFQYTLGTVVSSGVPAAGAGNLETVASVDRYAFTLSQNATVQYEYLKITAPYAYKIINVATGQTVGTGTVNKQFTLPAGDYVIEFGPGNKGTYSFRISTIAGSIAGPGAWVMV
ncbi:VWD domain-containing protein [Promicromonospora kroppenstedtii]|uniref:VWD domain-containing protein n=1 Tax=Promicromonospora kroppenstedtii TaxID=440482 RepID=A0ABW7XF54_9MICO